MQERRGALAVRMRFPSEPGQIPPQLVVQALNVVRVRLAHRVLGRRNDGSVGLVMIGAVLNVLRLRQLGLKHFGGCRPPVTEGEAHNLMTAPVYCPP